jgi:hypothetical protein
MRLKIPAFEIATGLLTLMMAAPYPAFSQASEANSRSEASDGAVPGLRDVQEQVQELSSTLRQMRAEMESARNEAIELRQELKSTNDQLRTMKDQLANVLKPASVAATPQAAAAAGTEPADAKQVESRVSKVEDDEQLLASKVDDQYQSKVESGSKYRVRLSGMALFNAFSTRGATDNFDLPDYALPRDPTQPNAAVGASLRQSIIGLDVSGPEIAGAKTSGDIQADFFGGFPNTWNGVTAGIVRLRTAGLRMDWQNTSIVAGQYSPLFSPLAPSSLASVAYPALASEGNLWVWTPQIYVEQRFPVSSQTTLSIQAGLMDPLSGEPPPDPFVRYPQAGETGGQPAYDARVAWKRSSEAGPFSIGAGGYYARQNWSWGRTIDSWAATADWQLPLSRWFALTGEFYRGQAIGGLGAAEGRSVATTGDPGLPQTIVRPLDSTGGWAQLKFMPTTKIEFNGAFGEDFSVPPYLGYAAPGYALDSFTAIARNQSGFVNGIYHLRSNLMFSLEYRRLRTADVQPGISAANQVTLSAATLF